MKKCVVLVYRHNIDKTLGNYNNLTGSYRNWLEIPLAYNRRDHVTMNT